ncbi:hypothetical protein [Methylocystis parvus]|uniref:hypothetical protein n=1 Tax=Methylocystis parvus TaxID=134 RepID=UPI003C73A656
MVAIDRRGEYTVAEIARAAGAKPRSVQHWAASGILLAIPQTNRAGTGTPRLFAGDEAIVACVMQALVARQTPVGELLRVSYILRDQFLTRGFSRRGILGKIIRGEAQAWLVDFPEQDDPAWKLVIKGGGESFETIFADMASTMVAIVIDLTAAFQGLREEARE